LAFYGDLAIRFATLEGTVDHLLQLLISKKDPVVGMIITSDMPFARKITKAKQLVRWRFCAESDIRDKALGILGEVDKLRISRNPFIHGEWEMNDEILSQGRARCNVRRFDYTETEQQIEWSGSSLEEWTYAQFQELSQRLAKVFPDLFWLLKQVSPETIEDYLPASEDKR